MTPYLHSTDYVSELFVILRYVLRNFSIAWLLLILEAYRLSATFIKGSNPREGKDRSGIRKGQEMVTRVTRGKGLSQDV
eukprot:1137651-Pelagomonas_calceolata.AAC.5